MTRPSETDKPKGWCVLPSIAAPFLPRLPYPTNTKAIILRSSLLIRVPFFCVKYCKVNAVVRRIIMRGVEDSDVAELSFIVRIKEEGMKGKAIAFPCNINERNRSSRMTRWTTRRFQDSRWKSLPFLNRISTFSALWCRNFRNFFLLIKLSRVVKARKWM